MQPRIRRDSEGLTGLNGVSWQRPANGSSDPNDGRNLDYCGPRLNPLTSHHSESGQSTLLKTKPPVPLSTGTGLAGEGVSEVPLCKVEDPESVGEIGPSTPTSSFMCWTWNRQQHYHRAVGEICAVADQVFTTNTIFLDGQSQETDSAARVWLHSSNSNRNYHLARWVLSQEFCTN